MPVLVPTRAEMHRLSANDRRKAVNRLKDLMRDHGLIGHPDDLRYQAPRDTSRAEATRAALELWAVSIRAEAATVLAALPPDPDAPAHRDALLEAIA